MHETRTSTDALIDTYIASWNETDAGARRALIDQAWAEDATYRDPLLSGEGRDGIDAMIAGFLAGYPNHTFARTGTAEVSGDTLTFTWEVRDQAGATVVAGTDEAVVNADGQLTSIVGTFAS